MKFSDKNHGMDTKNILCDRGARLRYAREMSGLTQKNIEKSYGIKAGTITIWENGRHYGLNEKSAHTMIAIFKAAGVICHAPWLLHGEGVAPIKHMLAMQPIAAYTAYSDQAAIIHEEILHFLQSHPGTIDYKISDHAMSPAFLKDDYVIGVPLEKKEWPQAVGHDCLIQLDSGEILVRKMREYCPKKGCTLICYQESTLHPYLYGAQMLSAAPICWHRRLVENLSSCAKKD